MSQKGENWSLSEQFCLTVEWHSILVQVALDVFLRARRAFFTIRTPKTDATSFPPKQIRKNKNKSTNGPSRVLLDRVLLDRVLLDRELLDRELLDRVLLDRVLLPRVLLPRVLLDP